MRATVTAVLISAGALCAQVPQATPADSVQAGQAGASSLSLSKIYDYVMVDFFTVFLMSWDNFLRKEAELAVKIPSAREGRESDRPAGEVILDVKSNGSVVMNRRSMDARGLQEKLSSLAKLNPDQAVVLRGDQDVNYEHIVEVLEVCRAANIWNVAFATRKAE